MSASCPNCGAPLHGRFCAACGQEDRPVDPTIRDVLHELAQEVSSLDGRVVRSVRCLFLSPGFLTLEHFKGRRASWMSPVRLYLLLSVGYFALTSFTGAAPFDVNFRITGDTDQDISRQLQQLGFSSADEPQRVVNQALSAWIPRAMFLLVPLFAWLVALARRRSGHHYPHHLIFTCHVFAVWFGAQSIAVAVGYVAPNATVKMLVGAAAMLYTFTYLIRALETVYGGSARRAAFHAVVILACYAVGTLTIAAAITAAAVFGR